LKRKNNTYGLVGKTLGHSFSQKYFTQKFKDSDSEEQYENFELKDIQDLVAVIDKRPNLRGLNVTIPYKEEVLKILDDVSEEAQLIGAVNTIKITTEGDLIGYNTDAFGFHQSIKPFLRGDCHRAIILGTGGASKAVFHVLNKIGIDCFFISRNPIGANQFLYEEMNQIMVESVGLIVNTTPVGTFPNIDDAPLIPYEFINENHLVVDLIYNPEKTKFLNLAEMKGATIQNGYSMLVHEAEKAYEIWNS